MIFPEYLLSDRPYSDFEELPSDKGLTILSGGARMYGYALLPGGKPKETHPCVIMLHGLPGYTTNHDIAQALRRMGFVVLNPFYRGAWGSEGCFTLSGMAEDAIAAINWTQTAEAKEAYGIDPDSVFLVGISMGGWAALNAICAEPRIQGAAILVPGDVGYFSEAREAFLRNAYHKYGCLNLASPEALVEDAAQCKDSLRLSRLIPQMGDKALCFIGGNQDTTIPAETVLNPLWQELERRNMTANKRCDFLDAGHSFANCRIALIQKIGHWLAEQMRHPQ